MESLLFTIWRLSVNVTKKWSFLAGLPILQQNHPGISIRSLSMIPDWLSFTNDVPIIHVIRPQPLLEADILCTLTEIYP